MISYEAWLAVQEELEDLELGTRVSAIYERWKQDSSRARAWEVVESDLIANGLLDD
jgi:hypothetical protein